MGPHQSYGENRDNMGNIGIQLAGPRGLREEAVGALLLVAAGAVDVVDQCWVAPIPVNAILNEQQMARIMYQWFYILVLYITVWGSVRLEERSVGVGARAITPREM